MLRSLIISCLVVSIACGHIGREPWHNYYDYLLGNYQLACAQPQASLAHYQQVLQSTNSPYPYEGFLQLLGATGNFSTIASLIPQLDKDFKENLHVQLLFLQALYETGQEQAADRRAIELQKKYKKSPELTFMAAQAHTKSSPVVGLEVIDEFLNHVPFQQRHCLFYYLKSQIYNQLNNRDKAVEFAKKSVDLCPHLQKRSVLYGLLNANKEQVAQPRAVPVHNPTANRVAHDAIRTTKRIQFGLMDSCVQDSRFLFDQKQYDAALSHIDHCLRQEPAHEHGRLLKIQILTAQGQSNRAAKLLAGWLEQEPNNQAWYQALYWLSFTGVSAEQVIQLLLGLAAKQPQNLNAQLYLADLYAKVDNVTAALDCHGKARLLCDCPQMRTKLLYNEGLLQFELGKYALAKQLLNLAQELGQQVAHVDNLLAYLYAAKDGNLATAQTLVTRALQKDAENPYFLDTQAFIWYRQGHHAKSLAQLEKLVGQLPNDYAVHLHLAKVYEKVGQTKKSAFQLHHARQLAKTPRQQAAYEKLVALII